MILRTVAGTRRGCGGPDTSGTLPLEVLPHFGSSLMEGEQEGGCPEGGRTGGGALAHTQLYLSAVKKWRPLIAWRDVALPYQAA